MEFLASCSLEESRKFNGKLEIPNDDGKHSDRVSLNIVADGNNVNFASLPSTVKCVTFTGDNRFAGSVPDNWKGNVFNEYGMDDLLNCKVTQIDGVVDLVRVSDDFCDMRTVYTMCKNNPSVRFIGGRLLNIDGVRIGRYDKGKDKMSPVMVDMYDTFMEVQLGNLDGIQEKVAKVRLKAEKIGKEKSKKGSSFSPKKASKRKEAFVSVFGSEEVAF